MSCTEEKNSIPHVVLLARYIIYTAAVFLLFLSIPHWRNNNSIAFFKENGCFEWLQFAMLCTSAAVLFAGRRICPDSRHILSLMAAIAAFAAGRELDKIMDALLPVLGWKVVFLFLVAAAVYCWNARQDCIKQILHFAGSYAFTMMWAAFIIAVPLAQLVGDGTLLYTFLQDDYNRLYKRIFEEACEGAGYLLLFFASLESVLFLKQHPPKANAADSSVASAAQE